MFDVLVIGAGPAGSFAAERLARAGANVALFDGRAKGEPKACGGGVTTKALKHWPELKIAPARFVDEVDLYSPVGSYIKLKLREPFAIYSRATLDSYLKNRARAAGATIIDQKVRLREQSPWVVEGDRKWSGRFLVAADGANSPLAKKLSGPIANSEMEVAFGYRVPLPATKTPRTSIVFLDSCPGYFWAFPRPDHISFGIATLQSRFSHKPLDSLLWKLIVAYYSSPDGLKTHWLSESALIQESPLLEKLKSSAQPYAARIPGLSSETLKRRKTAGEDWALVGDAAGFADPLTGEGIYYALKSAELFANAYGSKEDYQKMWQREFGGEIARASRMKSRFYGSFLGAHFTDRMVSFASIHRGIRRTLEELMAGEQGYTDLKKRLLLRSLRPF